jgi:hypothetical protein
MAASIVTDSSSETPMNSFHAVWTKFNYAASGDTVAVPVGCVAAEVLATGSWTTSIAAGATEDLITITGGTVGTGVVLVTRHGGNPASAR